MKKLCWLQILLYTVLTSTISIAQCGHDVIITIGDSVEMCADAPVYISANDGQESYTWSGPENLTGQSVIPQYSGVYVVAGTDDVGCTSYDTIVVTIFPSPEPTILSSEGNPICPGLGTTLSTSESYAGYDWGGGNTSSTYFVDQPGTYSVIASDTNGCLGSTAITVSEYEFDLTSTVLDGCEGGSVLLTASGGGSYEWSTDETTSSIEVTPTQATEYSVTITNGSCVEVLSTTANAVEILDFDLPDTVYLSEGETAIFSGPGGFESYLWSPSDYISTTTSVTVQLTAGETHVLTLEATHETGCVLVEEVFVIVLTLDVPTGLSPNGDGYNEVFIVPELYELEGSLVVWNRWGEIVVDEPHYKNNWDGTCQAGLCLGKKSLPEGTYFYKIVVGGIEFDGFITLKL